MFSINNHKITRIKKAKILGILFNDKAKWEDHIDSITNKFNFNLFIIKQLRSNGFNQKELIHAYITFIRSKLEYCSPVWGSCIPVKLVNKLERCQKRALSIILKKKIDRFNYNEVLDEVKLESLSVRIGKAQLKLGNKLFISKRFRNFLPKISDLDNRKVLRKRKGLFVENIYKERYSQSFIPKLIKLLNEEYIEKETIFGWKQEQWEVVEGKF